MPRQQTRIQAGTLEERRTTIEQTDDTIENRNGARQWIEKVAARWTNMDPSKRRAVITAMVDQIVVGADKITIQWASATTMATRHANGALMNLRGDVIEPKRRGRPRKAEATETGEGLDLETADMAPP